MVESSGGPIGRLLIEQQSGDPDTIVASLSAASEFVDATDLTLYLIDYGHTLLVPDPDPQSQAHRPEVASVDGTMAGKAFQSGTVLAADRGTRWQVWVPVQERSNTLGVLTMSVPVLDERVEHFCMELGYAAAYLLLASAHYSDLAHLLRRREDMDLAAEMQWSLLPPLSYASAGTTLAGLLEPAYEVGGDCFDYAANDGRLDMAIFDAMGHGLASAILTSLLVGAYRHSRRGGHDLTETTVAVDAAARTFPGPITFATAVFAQLELTTGRLSWVSSGHAEPIIVRGGTTLTSSNLAGGVPLGLGALGPVAGPLNEIALEPGDGVLLYTDGVTEARDPDGDVFGEQRLRDLLAREHHAGGPPQEVIRRLVRSALHHSQVRLRDDATLLYIRWSQESASAAAPRRP